LGEGRTLRAFATKTTLVGFKGTAKKPRLRLADNKPISERKKGEQGRREKGERKVKKTANRKADIERHTIESTCQHERNPAQKIQTRGKKRETKREGQAPTGQVNMEVVSGRGVD